VRLRYQNRATVLAVASVGSFLLDETPGLVPANDTEGEPAAAKVPQLKWINVANEGEYRGHGQGEFALTPEVMQQLVDNLHASPKFKLGEVTVDGQTSQLGCKRVVQYDYEHASEMAPWEGTIPEKGAPAIGWVWDLELRKDADGRLQLWALSWLGDQIRGQIAKGEYDSVSIAWNPNGKHWVTGEPIGAVLTSIAFTNHPFLQDLESLAAREIRLSRRAGAGGGTGGGRAAGQPPTRSVQPRARSVEAPADTSTPPRERASASMTPENRKRLCSMFGLMDQADDAVIIRAAENANSSGGSLAAVLAALGFQGDVGEALKGVASLKEMEKQLQSALAELQSLNAGDAAADEAQVDPDVAAAMTSRGLVNPQGMVDPLLHSAFKAHRGECIRTELAKCTDKSSVGDKRAARERGRQTFLQSCGVVTDPRTAHLNRTFVAGPGAAGPATQYPVTNLVAFGGVPQTPGVMPGAQPMQLRAPGMQPLPTIDWSAYSGNMTQRIMGYLASQDPAFEQLDLGSRIKRASDWRRQNGHLLPQAAA
jgi:hypothetical protein